MKMFGLMFLAAFTALADTDLGTYGVTKITTDRQSIIVAVSYDDIGGAGGMSVSNLVKTTNLTAGDQLVVYLDRGTHESWLLATNELTGALFWTPNEKTFTRDAAGNLIEGAGISASDTNLLFGTGLWLVRAAKPTEAYDFYVYGRPVNDPTYVTTAKAWHLVGNPTQQDREITEDLIRGSNMDSIAVPGNGELLVNYIFRTGKGWRRTQDASGQWGPAPVIPAGTGFWLKTAKPVTIKWRGEE